MLQATPAPPPTFARFSDVFDTLYPQFIEASHRSGTHDQTAMRVRQSGHEKVVPANPDIVFRLVTGGALTHSSVDCGNGQTRLSGRQGSLYIAPPDSTAEWRSAGSHELLMLSVPRTHVTDLMEAGDDPLRSLYGRDIFHSRIAYLLETIWTEMTTGGPGARLKVDGLFLNLLGALQAVAADTGPAPGRRRMPRLDAGRLGRVLDYVDAHLGEAISLPDLAGVACYSVHHFSRAFAAAMHMTPHQYLTERRIARARALMVETDLTLAEIAYAVGFANQAHFTTQFKAHLDETPGRFRAAASA